MKYFFNIYVFYFFLLPIFILLWGYNFDFRYIFILFLFLFFFLGLNLSLLKINPIRSSNYSVLSINTFFLLSFFLLYFIDLQTRIDTLFSLFNGEYFKAGIEKSIERYNYETKPSVLSQFSTIFYFSYCFTLGIKLSENIGRSRKFLFLLLWFILAVFETSTLSRASLVLGLTGIATTAIYNYRYKLAKISLINIHVYFFCILLFLGIVFLISAFGRVSTSDNAYDIVFEKISSYTIAMYDALLRWLIKFDFTSLKFGVNTFTFIPKIFGVNFESGYYLLEDTQFGETNIYTFIRGLIEDFSLFSLFVCFIFGLQINWLNTQNNPSKYTIFFNLWVVNFFLYPMISIFNFTTYFVGYFIFIVFVRIKKNNNCI